MFLVAADVISFRRMSRTRKFNLWWIKLGYLEQEWWTVAAQTAQTRDLLVLFSAVFYRNTNCLRVQSGVYTNTFPIPFKIRSLFSQVNHFDIEEDGIISTRQSGLRTTFLLLMFKNNTRQKLWLAPYIMTDTKTLFWHSGYTPGRLFLKKALEHKRMVFWFIWTQRELKR